MQMQFILPQNQVESVYCVSSAGGGQDRETDSAYRERIRTYGLAYVTTGPQERYESVAKNVSSEIIDARAINQGAGNVGIALLMASESGSDAIIAAVTNALSARTTRPMTDYVTVFEAEPVEYTLNVELTEEAGTSIDREAVAEAYKEWQDKTIGRAFNPDRLMAALYSAGASRVIWGAGSNFDGGAVAYTEIDADQYCKGTITFEVTA